MVTKITYTCDRESLGEIDIADFVDAMKNEISAVKRFRSAAVEVRVGDRSDSSVAGYDLGDEDFGEQIADCAERAFAACCAA